uniref:Uncharacterized protein n=1 Tax=Manihot esculenta TaxID=3983 RepID=A0A2C9U2Q1_MANES
MVGNRRIVRKNIHFDEYVVVALLVNPVVGSLPSNGLFCSFLYIKGKIGSWEPIKRTYQG